MKISNIVSTAAAGVFALGISASVAAAEQCVIALPFDFGSAAISSTNQGLLNIIRTKYNGTTVDLAGYTDAVGSAASNLALSRRRAETVSKYIQQGTSIKVNNVTGLGESNLVVDTAGPNQLNRRVEITIDNCNAADFGVPPGAGVFGGAGAAAAVLGAILIIGAIGNGSSGTTTTTTGPTGTGTGN